MKIYRPFNFSINNTPMKAKQNIRIAILFVSLAFISNKSFACSIVYYVDSTTGKIYVANNEDYWYKTKNYMQIMPAKKGKMARIWYGWNKFAQGGINSSGLFMDGAATPKQRIPKGYRNPNGRNVGDEILAYCHTVQEAIDYLEKEKIAVSEGHIFLGDSTGNAAIVEWVKGKKNIINIESNVLIATNFLLSDTNAGNFPCVRYQSIEERINNLKESNDSINLRSFGNVIAGAVQPPIKDSNGKEGGTLYSTFIDIKDGVFVLVPKLDNKRVIKLDLNDEFRRKRRKKIKF